MNQRKDAQGFIYDRGNYQAFLNNFKLTDKL